MACSRPAISPPTPASSASACDLRAAALGEAGVIGADGFLDHLGRQQLVLEALKDPPLDDARGDRPVVVAGAGLAEGRAAEPVGADHRVGAAAARQAAEQPLRPAPDLFRAIGDRRLQRLLVGPEGVVDDAQLGDLADDPLRSRVQARLALAGRRVLAEALAIVDQLAHVFSLVKDPVAALPVAVDRGRVPPAGARAGDAVGVQPGGDLAR